MTPATDLDRAVLQLQVTTERARRASGALTTARKAVQDALDECRRAALALKRSQADLCRVAGGSAEGIDDDGYAT